MYVAPQGPDWERANVMEMCFDVLFPTGFTFVRGGKLFGLFGGAPKSCTNPPEYLQLILVASTQDQCGEQEAGENYIQILMPISRLALIVRRHLLLYVKQVFQEPDLVQVL